MHGQAGVAKTPEHRAHISAALKGRKCSPEHVARNSVAHKGLRRTKTARANQSAAQVTHGRTHSPIYHIWADMKSRCSNAGVKAYKYYGGRGITVCARWWNSFENFLADMGERPEGLTIDRIDNDGNYEPDNCHWATRQEQRANQRSGRAA